MAWEVTASGKSSERSTASWKLICLSSSRESVLAGGVIFCQLHFSVSDRIQLIVAYSVLISLCCLCWACCFILNDRPKNTFTQCVLHHYYCIYSNTIRNIVDELSYFQNIFLNVATMWCYLIQVQTLMQNAIWKQWPWQHCLACDFLASELPTSWRWFFCI